MIEAIREIGEYANKNSGEKNILENFSKKIPFEKKNIKGQLVKQHIVIFNFDINKQIIECNFEEVKEDSGKKYLWLGNNPGNKSQIFFTSDSFSFIFGDSLYNIKERVETELRSNLQNLLATFFKCDGGNNRVQIEKFCCLDDNKRRILIENLEMIKTDLEKEKSKDFAKKFQKKYLDELNKIVLKSLNPGLNPDEVAVYTLALNGSPLVHREEYRKMLYHEKLGCLFDPKNKSYKDNLVQQGNCSLCDKKNLATTSTATNLSFKFYMTDKLGFSSNLDGKFTKNFNICKTCYTDLIAGERFIDNNLKTYLGGINCYVIPSILFKNPKLDYVRFSKYIIHKNNALSNLITLPQFEKELKEFREFEDEKNNFVINYLFYRKGKSDFKILKLVMDVPPSRLDTIINAQLKISSIVDRNYPHQHTFLEISLRNIYYTTPIGKNDRSYSTFLNLLDAIFSAKSIDYSFLIKQYTEVLRIIFYERRGYNIKSPRSGLELKTLQLNFALLFFKELKLLRGLTMEKESDIESIPAEIKKFWQDTGIYDDSRKILFLLGYMIGNIGNSQYRSGHKTKPILNKLNFQGMSVQSILRLTNDVFEKMIQYKILKYNESLFHQYKKMIDTHSQNWDLTNQENVFYILSGYSFVTYQAISKGEIESQNQEKLIEGGEKYD